MQVLRLKRLHYAVGFFLWLAVIFWSASQPGSGESQAISGLDKIQHFVAYGVLAFLLAKAIYRYYGWSSMVVIVLAVVLIGVCDELYQATIVNRTSSLFDVVADGVGAVAGFILAWVIQITTRGKQSESITR